MGDHPLSPRGDADCKDSMDAPPSGHALRSGPEVKMEEVVPKMVCRRSSDSPSVLSCIGKRTREGCDHGSRARTVPLRKPKESGRTDSCEKDFIFN